jgi:hypothetical protein
MFNKRGLAVSAIIILTIGILVGAGLLWGDSLVTNLFGVHNSKYNVDTLVAKCKVECASGSKFDYCSAKKDLKSSTETLYGVTCFSLTQTRPEYNVPVCDKINCGEETPEYLQGDYTNTGNTQTTIPETPLDPKTCKEKYWENIVKYSSKSYKSPAIDPILLYSILLVENTACTATSFNKADQRSAGLMQIDLQTACVDSRFGLPPTIEDCKSFILKNPEKSIEIASIILRDKYAAYGPANYPKGKLYQGCNGFEETYKGWIAAVRGYNGWGLTYKEDGTCDPETNNYVTKVLDKCASLNKGYSCFLADGKFSNLIYN